MSAFVPGFENDVFISYAHEEKRVWIGRFVEKLKEQMWDQYGIKISIWQDTKNLRIAQNWQDEIEEGIKRSAILLAILSPGYEKSEWCMKECEIFQQIFDGEEFEKSGRFFKVVKMPWKNDEHRDFWSTIEHLELFKREDGSADVKPFSFASNDFQFAIRSLATGVERTLRQLRRARERIFVASPVGEGCRKVWKELQGELHVNGYDVQPEGLYIEGFGDEVILRDLKDALLSVHLLGPVHAPLVQRQIQLAADLERKLMFWLASSEDAADANQARLIAALRNGHLPDCPEIKLPPGWEFLSALTPRRLIQEILEVLKPAPQVTEQPPLTGGVPRIYIVHDATTKEDARIAATLQGEIHAREKMEVFLSRADLPSPVELQLRHRMLLQTCEGVLLCRKDAPQEWLMQVAPEVLLADQLLHRQEPLKSKGFLVPDPASWSEWPKLKVIPYGPLFRPGDLEPFLAPLRTERSVAHGG